MKSFKELYELAAELCDGQEVFFQGLRIRARVIPDNDWSGIFCGLSSLCQLDMTHLCMMCDAFDGKKHILYLSEKE